MSDQSPDDIDDPFSLAAELRSFGRRRGRKWSPEQARIYGEVLPTLTVDLSRPIEVAASLFPRPVGAVWLEIGFGGGEHLLAQAMHRPDVGFIGCEPFEDGVIKVAGAVEASALTNVRLQPDDARPLLRWLPARSIDRAFVLFPDPWPKRRHHKRRFVNVATLAALARVMRAGADLRIGTDIGDYVRTMMIEVAAEDSFEWTAVRPVDWRRRPADWPETRYEQKANREGRRCYYFNFVRKA
jgi:tRNA (guanine-N7-)-methyltransferase